METEHDNMRAIFSWALEQEEADTALRLGSTLWFFWQTRVHYSEGRKWLERTLSLPGAQLRNAGRAAALQGLAQMAWLQYDFPAVHAAAEESLAIWRELDKRGEATGRGIASLAYALVFAGTWAALANDDDRQRGRALNEEGLALLRKLGDKWGIATALLDLGITNNGLGDYERARAALYESLSIFKELGDKWGQAQTLNTRGDTARIQGDYGLARTFYEEGLRLYRELNIRADIPAALHNLGYVTLAHGELDEARRLFIESLDMQVEAQNTAGIAENLTGLAGLADAMSLPERAARLLGAADALIESIDARRWPAEQVEHDRILARARARLDQASWERAREIGKGMTVEQAVAYGLEGTEP
jgi:tetratricopeptide (TPR) repeat protein